MSRLKGTPALVWVLAAACAAGTTEPEHRIPATLVIVAGDNQTSTVASALSTSPTVRVLDQHRQPLAGVSVAFAVISGGGSVSPAAALTDAAGNASTMWKLGQPVGPNVVTARADGLDSAAVFHAAGVPGAARSMVALSPLESATVATPVAIAPAVSVKDEYGNGVPGITVSFSVVDSGGAIAGSSATSDSSGTASAQRWTLGTRAGKQLVRVVAATSPSLSATISAVALPGPPAALRIVSGDGQNGRPGSLLDTTLVARVTDRYDNPVAGVTTAWASTTTDTVSGSPRTSADGLTVATVRLAHVVGARSVIVTAADQPAVTFTVRGLGAVDLTVGLYHACELLSDGTVWCWGTAGRGLFPGSGAPCYAWLCTSAAVHVARGYQFSQIAAGYAANCGLTTPDGKLVCWGDNTMGQLGNGIDGDRSVPFSTPTPVVSTQRFDSVFAGLSGMCARTTDGDAYCWGSNNNGQLGVGFVWSGDGSPGYDVPIPTRVLMRSPVRSVAVGWLVGCALDSFSRAWCWGPTSPDSSGQPSDPRLVSPTALSAVIPFVKISATSQSVCGIDASVRAIYCWPDPSLSYVGTIYDNPPVRLPGTDAYIDLAGGSQHSCAITTQGDVMCWGDNSNGALGDGTRTSSSTPVRVLASVKFTRVGVGWHSSCALAASGMPYCWGQNAFLQLGDPSFHDTSTPELVP